MAKIEKVVIKGNTGYRAGKKSKIHFYPSGEPTAEARAKQKAINDTLVTKYKRGKGPAA